MAGTIFLIGCAYIFQIPWAMQVGLAYALLGDLSFCVVNDYFPLPVLFFTCSHLLYMLHYGDPENISQFIHGGILLMSLCLSLNVLGVINKDTSNGIAIAQYTVVMAYILVQSSDKFHLYYGYVLFVLSDILIFITDYIVHYRISKYLTLVLYYLAQCVLLAGSGNFPCLRIPQKPVIIT